jgi:GntR family transcriptional regulator/MocR family aminotransferase
VDRSRVIYFDTFNHVLFPALRIAYAVIPLGLLDQVIAARKGVDGSTNVPDQMILADFIAGGHLDLHLARLAACRAERGAALRHLLEHDLQEIVEPVGSASAHFICRPRISLSRLLLAGGHSGVVIENMADLRLVPEGPDQVILGYFGFTAAALAKAAAILRTAVLSTSHGNR